MENKDIIDFAVILIEEAYKGVDKLKYGLNCRQIDRQLGEEGEGFIVEFYGIGCIQLKIQWMNFAVNGK